MLFRSQALQGILQQKTTFDFEIVIGDDCSTDATEHIISEFTKRYPNKIKYHRHKTNIGMIGNWINTIQSCKGEYIAIIEGDDFWTDPNKLQAQAIFLDSKSEYSMCFHKLGFQAEKGVNQNDFYLDQDLTKSTFTINDVILNKWFIGTCSIMVRNGYWQTFPNGIFTLKAIDKIIQLMAADKGKIGYLHSEMGVYRIHPHGISQQQWLGKENTFEFAVIDLFKVFDRFSNMKYHQPLKQRIEQSYLLLLTKNKLLTRYHTKAFWGLTMCNHRKAMGLVRDYVIVRLIPKRIYTSYTKLKMR